MSPPDGAADLRGIIEGAEAVDVSAAAQANPMPPIPPMPFRPHLVVCSGDLPATARELRDLFTGAGYLFDREGPVKVVQPADAGPMIATGLTVNGVVIEAHRLCQPVKLGDEGKA